MTVNDRRFGTTGVHYNKGHAFLRAQGRISGAIRPIETGAMAIFYNALICSGIAHP
jgi:hypothetical protein